MESSAAILYSILFILFVVLLLLMSSLPLNLTQELKLQCKILYINKCILSILLTLTSTIVY